MSTLAFRTLFWTLIAGICIAGAAHAGEVLVTTDIAVSTIWTANNTYNLQKQIYVLPGATLTIQAGTVVASTTNLGGSLAVCQGAKIFVQGTQQKPVIMTSKADVGTWTNNNPKTGKWREAANEWGNLTIMGQAYISEDATPGNTPTPNANNWANMEGLVGKSQKDPNVIYGGGNDNDDSGTITFLSIRYGGKVVSLNNELNGMSLGGIGRGTDIHHVEIMNNVDDGIEIWGGTVNLKYVSIWNIGDDSFDIDQGWRGKAQFGLIVQGYSLDASQGSGVGDNCLETDGAEQSDYQPVTTTSIYNFTVIGQPTDGDGATAWRDNARVQYHNCIFMDCGEKVVRFDNIDGDGGKGYGFNGTLDWATTWKTSYTNYSTVNAPANPAAFYQSQTSGMLCEMTDSVFYNNKDYTEADARGVFNAANNNVKEPTASPITAITRGTAVVKGGKVMQPVTFLDPRPANSALTSAGWAPNDGFYSSERFRGAFRPDNNWLRGWTASEAYGFTQTDPHADLGYSLIGKNGAPVLATKGTLQKNTPFSIEVSNGLPNSVAFIALGTARWDFPMLGGTVVPNFATLGVFPLFLDSNGYAKFGFPWPDNQPSGFTYYLQAIVADSAGPQFVSMSNAVSVTTP